MFDADSQRELDKYLVAFKDERYRRKSGLHLYANELLLRRMIGELEAKSAVDFGCGNGHSAICLLKNGIEHVDLVDFMPESVLSDDIRPLLAAGTVKFTRSSLWDAEMPDFAVDLAVCTDVMEHIPEEKVETVLAKIAKSAKATLFRIAMFGDSPATVAKYNGHIHCTVHDPEWWDKRLRKHFARLDHKDVERSLRRPERQTYVLAAYRE